MVGIPRSKGCITCRRRKLGCDGGRPKCERCVKSRRSCEGYESYPVFIRRDARGLVPRRRFDEAKSPATTQLYRKWNLVWEKSVVDWFWTSQSTTSQEWLRHALWLPLPTMTLRKSLLALSLTRWGRINQNYDAVLGGQYVHSECLTRLQKALYDPQLMWHDETLASIRAMSLYELYETTSGNPDAWQTHLSGVTRWIELRGPEGHRSKMMQALFADVRYALMLKALMQRKASPFGKKEWRMYWKDPEQQMYDLGFDMAAALERADCGVYDFDAYNELHYALGELRRQELAPVVLLNLLTLKLLLSFVATPAGLSWASESFADADLMMEMLPSISASSESHRCIFPLTCLSWHYRTDPEKSEEVNCLRRYITKKRQVKFANDQYDAQNLIPRVALD